MIVFVAAFVVSVVGVAGFAAAVAGVGGVVIVVARGLAFGAVVGVVVVDEKNFCWL